MSRSRRWLLLAIALAVAPVRPALAGECSVRATGVTLQEVTVNPLGAPSLQLDLDSVAVTARISSHSNGVVQLDVSGSIRFRAQRENVWFRITEDYTSPDGSVLVTRGARIIPIRTEGDLVVGTAVLRADDVMPGENKQPDDIASPVRIPCRMLSLAIIGVASDEWEPPGATSDGLWRPRRDDTELQLRVSPDDHAPAIDLHSSCTDCFLVERIGRRGPWIRVQAVGHGVAIRGWIRAARMVRMPEEVGFAGGSTCSGHGQPGPFLIGKAPSNVYEGPARVRAGAPVLADAPGGQWATFAVDTQVRVHYVRGTPWVGLTSIPGLRLSPLADVTVSVSDVVFPPGALLPVPP